VKNFVRYSGVEFDGEVTEITYTPQQVNDEEWAVFQSLGTL
jgi:hypothetical protein